MYIKAIYLENIQSWTKPTTIYLSNGLNIIKGKNDAGKSASQYGLRIFSGTLTSDDYKTIISEGKEKAVAKLYLSNRTILEAQLSVKTDYFGKRTNLKTIFRLLNWQEDKVLKYWDSLSADIPKYLGLLSTPSGICLNLSQLEKKIFVSTQPTDNTEIIDLFTNLDFVEEKLSYLKIKQKKLEDINRDAELLTKHYEDKIQHETKPIVKLERLVGTLENNIQVHNKIVSLKLLKLYKLQNYLSQTMIYLNTLKILNLAKNGLKNCTDLHRKYSNLDTLFQVQNLVFSEKSILQNRLNILKLEQELILFNQLSKIKSMSNVINSCKELNFTKNKIQKQSSELNQINTISHKLNSLVNTQNNVNKMLLILNSHKTQGFKNNCLIKSRKVQSNHSIFVSLIQLLQTHKSLKVNNKRLLEVNEQIKLIPICPTCNKPL